MDSVHFQKNPWLGQVYWTEVCSREKKPHLFHYTRVSPPTVARPFPVSTAKAHFHAGQGLGIIVERRQLPGVPTAVTGDERPATALTTSGRMVSTPRPATGTESRPCTTGPLQAGRDALELPRGANAGLLRPTPSPRSALPSFRGHRLTPSQRPPAGA
mmetsp:Transcript_62139/g.145607  ORF Transcript_62139/g.145607 Transcript_62139/m.145607 type:complete len:158 (-) Transcript_62139:98-571(-)